jgi:hypothetical protein
MYDPREPGGKTDGEDARAAQGSRPAEPPRNPADQSLETDGTAATPAHNPGGGHLGPPCSDEPE